MYGSEPKMQTAKAGDRRYRTGMDAFTIPTFAKHFGLPVGQVRRAVRDGTIRTVPWAGVPRITPAEAERIAELFGLKPRDTSGSQTDEE
jgi:hypothetical protein